ncbi:unnamed protein product [Urochloa humidicola]
MRRTAALLSSHGGSGGGRSIPQALAAVLVCPLTKKPIRYWPETPSVWPSRRVSFLPALISCDIHVCRQPVCCID